MAEFNDDAVRRISKVVRAYENGKDDVPTARSPRIVQPSRNAITTSVIGACSGTTKGSGTATIYVDDGSGTGATKVWMTNVKIWSWFTSSVPSGKHIIVEIIDGKYQITNSDC